MADEIFDHGGLGVLFQPDADGLGRKEFGQPHRQTGST